MKKLLFSLLFLLGVVSCNQEQHFKIHDIIPPIKLVAGTVDSLVISDLFYAPNYDLTFFHNDVIDVNYSGKVLKLTSKENFEGLTTLEFDLEGQVYFIPVYSKVIDNVKFEFKPAKNYKFISLFGSFNGWNRQELPLSDENTDGIYDIKIPLEPGRYEYKFFGDGEEILDPKNETIVPNGIGGYNSVINIPEKFTGKMFLHKDSTYTLSTGKEYIFYLQSDSQEEFNCKDVVALLDNENLSAKEVVCYDNKVKIFLDNYQLEDNQMLRVAVSVMGQVSNIQMIPLHGDTFSWYDGVIYSLMVDRFNNGDSENDKPIVHDSLSTKANYMGGDLQGVINKLNEGYFNNLGINTIWISPVYSNPNEAFKESPEPHRYYSGYHGYWPTHHLMVEEHFGDMKKLQELVKTAHDHGIKILLDFVSNHVHEQHPFYKNHKEWFGKLELPDGRLNLRFWDEYRLTTWFEPYLPSFDYEKSDDAVEAMTDNAVWWLKTSGADGFRHDAVKHVPNKFWRRLTQKIKEKIEIPNNVSVYQIGETFGNYDMVSSYVNPGQLSAQFNFEIYNVAQGVFVDPKRSFIDLANEMRRTESVYGSLHFMGNIMDSHDKDRFMAYADGDLSQNQGNSAEIGWANPPVVDNPYNYKKAEIYYAFMMSIPGLPVVYYGSEFGMTGAADPDNRRMMRFDIDLSEGEKDLLGKVSEIVKLRRTHTALRYGDFFTIMADNKIFSYIRSDFEERILTVINKENKPAQVVLDLPEIYHLQKARSIKTGNVVEVVNNQLQTNMDDNSWDMFILE